MPVWEVVMLLVCFGMLVRFLMVCDVVCGNKSSDYYSQTYLSTTHTTNLSMTNNIGFYWEHYWYNT